MGGAIAHRLLGAGLRVLGYDIDPDKAVLIPGIETAVSADAMRRGSTVVVQSTIIGCAVVSSSSTTDSTCEVS